MVENIQANEDLYFVSRNEQAPTTIVLLHGLFSCNLEWAPVASHLGDYHLLIPDLPQHSRSKQIQPFSFQLAADKVASLISTHAHDGKADVVGLSLGGFVTMELVRRHSDFVRTAFVTGATPLTPWQLWATERPNMIHRLLGFSMRSGIYSAAAWYSGLELDDELKTDISANNTLDLVTNGYGEVANWDLVKVAEVGRKDVRILVAASEKGDDVKGAKATARTIRESATGAGKKTIACSVGDAIHGWSLQFPELFAMGIRAWLKEDRLPAGYAVVDIDGRIWEGTELGESIQPK